MPEGMSEAHPDASDDPLPMPVAHQRAEPVGARLFARLPRLQPRAGKWLARGVAAGALCAYAVGMAGAALVVDATRDLPSLAALTERSRPVSIRFLDRHGAVFLERGGQTGPAIDAASLPPHVRGAIISIEDARFASHIGVDAEAIARALRANLQSGRRAQGGSTLTQQLVKNVFLTPDKTYRRKVQEALLAVAMERTYTKDEVLELYLERVYFGAGYWGLGAAAEGYFGKTPDALSVSEAALLAGLLRAPSQTNPVADPARAGERAAAVLRTMEAARWLDRDARRAALTEPLRIRPPASALGVNHFADWVWPQVESRLGIVTTDIDVLTTLDADLQSAAEAAVHAHLDPARGAEEAALVTVDGSGDVLAMVGGHAYARSQFNRATQARRQPGSAFKPFVYLAALEAGRSPWDTERDEVLEVDGWSAENFTPTAGGDVRLVDAFARSLNTVAVRVGEDAGRDRIVDVAARFGLDVTPLPSLSLGAQGATVLDLAGAYGPFANWGRYAEPRGLLAIRLRDGTPLYTAPAPQPKLAVAGAPLRDLNAMMRATVRRGTGTRARVEGRDVAGKTGTTNGFRDAWFAGVAPGYATAVWVGNDANTSMDSVTGGSIPSAIFADTMSALLRDRPVSELPASPEPIWTASRDPALDELLAAVETAISD